MEALRKGLTGSFPSMIALAGLLALAGCDAGGAENRAALEAAEASPPAESVGRAGAGPRELVIRTFDYRFDAPDTILAGPTTIRLVNDGPDFHHVWLVRLEEGRSAGELIEPLAAHGPLPSWAVAVGGPNTPGAPGEETVAAVDLEPGEYALVCVIPGMQDGELHVAKGMIRPLTVMPSGEARVLSEPDLVMTLDDYTYELDRPITPGRHAIRVVNAAAQPHEVVVVRLEPGRTAMDFLAFLQKPEGAPPGKMIGGVTWLSRGESNVMMLDFEPGEYALLCFVPDEGDGRLHLEHGMIDQFRVG